MKQTAKRILAFVSVVCIAFLGIVTMPFVQVNAEDTTITFELGANGSASHNDGSSKTSYTETVEGYTLNITGGVKMYTGARDQMGNSCIKLGTGSAAGSFSMTVPADVTSVIFAVAKYKTNTTKISVNNGTAQTLTKNSDSGEYDEIPVDTTSTKTISFKTVSGGYRAMVNTITYVVASGETTDPSITISTESNLAQVQVGDEVSFEAKVENVDDYTIVWDSTNKEVATIADGKLTANAMGKTTVTATIDGMEVSDSKEVTVYPSNAGVITIAEAIEICGFVGENETPIQYSVTGTVDSIDEAYSEQYKNITVTISDETGSIKAYHMEGGSDLVVDAQIKVTGTLTNYNGTTPEFVDCAYEEILSDEVKKIKEDLGKVNAWMSMGYKYVQSSKLVDVPSEVVDTLNRAFTGVTGTSYTSWSGKTASSDAVYAGESAGGNESIQLRTTNSREGVVTTASGGKATKVEIAWNSNTNSKRILQVYGSNTAYSSAADLFATDKQGTLLGELAFASNQTIVEIDEDYEFIGIRSKDSALYLDSVSITWVSGTTGSQVEKDVLSDSQFRLKFGVDESLFAIENVSDFGITITAGEKTKTYNSTATLNWKYDEENNRKYVVIDLGDIVNDKTKLTTEFTVQTYVVVGERTFEGNKKTYSVASMIEAYYADENTKAQVEVLYNYLKDNGVI